MKPDIDGRRSQSFTIKKPVTLLASCRADWSLLLFFLPSQNATLTDNKVGKSLCCSGWIWYKMPKSKHWVDGAQVPRECTVG